MSCMKHVGLNVMADPVFTVSYTGVNGGLVFCVADDPGMHSSQNEQDSRHYAKAAKIMMLEPSDSAECKEFTKKAFELSEQFDTPVFLRLSTRVSHSQSLVEIGERANDELKDYTKNPAKYVMMPGNAIKRHVVVEERMKALAQFAETAELNVVEDNGAKIGIISAGDCYMYAKEALGSKANYLKLGIIYPLPTQKIIDFAKNLDKVYVLEELDPFIEEHCKAIGVDVIGKDAFTLLGEYSPNMIKKVVLGEDTETAACADEPIPVRPPVMCPGCPHRGSFYVLKKLGLTVCGDIGCYTLGAVAPLAAMDMTLCMGASISAIHGFNKALGEQSQGKTVAVIGDSTFTHSGMTGLLDCVNENADVTIVISDNETTAMTGGQDSAGTGRLEAICAGIGVAPEHIRVVVPLKKNYEEMKQIIREEIEHHGVSVIIPRRECIQTLARKKRNK